MCTYLCTCINCQNTADGDSDTDSDSDHDDYDLHGDENEDTLQEIVDEDKFDDGDEDEIYIING